MNKRHRPRRHDLCHALHLLRRVIVPLGQLLRLETLCAPRHEVQLPRDQWPNMAERLVHLDELAWRLYVISCSAPRALWEGPLHQPLLSRSADDGHGLLLHSVNDEEQGTMNLFVR